MTGSPGRLDADDLSLLSLLATGASLEVIARRLDLSERTVRRRVRRVCDRLQVGTPMEAVAWAARRHLV
ncbi:MAG TPA: LuxR C-terminal-related transcriptional regulator [Nocardioidaceae bacterium]|nr:LuxR C-terminal-related transcriptional regulator [Nocardioidaceae bacterium]